MSRFYKDQTGYSNGDMKKTTTTASFRAALISAISPKIRYYFLFTIFGISWRGCNFRGYHLAFPTMIALILVVVPTTKDVHFNYTFRAKEITTGWVCRLRRTTVIQTMTPLITWHSLPPTPIEGPSWCFGYTDFNVKLGLVPKSS